VSRTFDARFAGTCGSCTERFAAGDPVRFIEDEICHDTCEERRVAGKAETVCMTCFLTTCDCGADA
jgi:hypothetical protein